MNTKQIFAHVSGGTYRFEESIQQFSPSTKGRVRQPVSVVSDATLAHERHVAREYTWPPLPQHLRGMPSARAMVRHWVRTNYEWKPTLLSPAPSANLPCK